MYEVGVIAAIEERLNGSGGFDIYVGCSAGSVVAALLANGVRGSEIYRVIDQDLEHPLNFRRGAVYASNSFRHAAGRFGRLLWAVGKNAMTGVRRSVPDMLAAAERDLPAGFLSLAALESYMRQTFSSFGLQNSFNDWTPEADACNAIAVKGGAEKFPKTSARRPSIFSPTCRAA